MVAMSKENTQTSWSFSDLVKETPVPEKYEFQLRANQVAMMKRLSLLLVVANLFNVAIVMMSFWNGSAESILAIWCTAMIVANGLAYLFNRRGSLPTTLKSAERQLERIGRGAAIAGIMWALASLIVMSTESAQGQMVMGIILASVMFAGAFLLSRLPEAAFSFMIPIAIGIVIAMQFQQDPSYRLISILAFVYLAVLIAAVKWSHKQYVDSHLSEAAVQEQSMLIGLLLRDFEESTSDWLWQTDRDGTLSDIPLLGEEKGNSDIMIAGRNLADLFVDDEASTTLGAHLERRQSFKDIVVNVPTDGEDLWVSITGKPIYDEDMFVGFRGVASNVTQTKEAESRIAYMAHFDSLTDLPNRVSLQEQLESELRQKTNSGHERALLWIDLDNFKWVNDTLGHQAGDELLRQVADRMRAATDSADFVSRLSGDEFAIIIERSEESFETFLDFLSQTLADPYDLWGSTVNCSASIGVRTFDLFTTDAGQMLKHADLALYQAKKLGKATWCRFTPDLAENAKAKLQIEADINRALEQNELQVYFQPLVDSRSQDIVCLETLLRWNDPKRGLVFPDQFIQHAEENGLITRIGDWVIRAALDEARKLPENIKISVNISPLQIHSASLMSTIINALATNEIAPSRLELEITESVLMSDTEFTLERLHQIKDLGVRIALDDFGTGFSSLSYLRSFPFDKIKIDKSFVTDIENREDNRAITQATLNLAKSLGMRCTAEGVETQFQAEFLRDNGCDELQGFLISRAQPLAKLAHLIDLKSEDEMSQRAANTNVPLPVIPRGKAQRS